jgi:hypothetical protein
VRASLFAWEDNVTYFSYSGINPPTLRPVRGTSEQDAMNAPIFCPKCPQRITPAVDGRLPPWCPRCGVNLRQDPVTPPPPTTAISAEPLEPTPLLPPGANVPGSPRVPFFQAFAPAMGQDSHELYRIYFTSTDLLIFQCGIGTVSMGQIMPRTKSRITYAAWGVIPMIMKAIARAQEGKHLRYADRMQDLDMADEDTLRDYASMRDGSFIADADDVKWLRIDPPSGWYRFWHRAEHEGVLRFAHRTMGKMALALPTTRDVRLAREELPKLFGDAVQINLHWGSSVRGTLTEQKSIS